MELESPIVKLEYYLVKFKKKTLLESFYGWNTFRRDDKTKIWECKMGNSWELIQDKKEKEALENWFKKQQI